MDLLAVGFHRGHHPLLLRGVPKHLGVAELLAANVEHRVAGVALPGAAVVAAGGQVLVLNEHHARPLHVARIEGHEAVFLAGREQAGGIIFVHHGAAREYHRVAAVRIFVLGEGHGLWRPVQQVGAAGVAPAQVAGVGTLGVVLVKQLVLAVGIHQAVSVVNPVLGCREVVNRSVRVGGRVGHGGLRRALAGGEQQQRTQ